MTNKTVFSLIVALCAFAFSAPADAVTKIAYVGDSIKDRFQTYPAQLPSMLGEGYEVIDLYKPLAGKPELVLDKVHPKAAAKIMAEVVWAAIIQK